MLKNFLVVTLRGLRKNAFYSFINITGLSIGIACSILILLWVYDEITYNSFHPKYERLYQVYINSEFDGEISSWNSLPQPSYEGLKNQDNSIKNTVITDWGNEHLLTVDDIRLKKIGLYTTEEFLEMFEFPLLKGDPSQVLDDPASIVLTKSCAEALFGDEDPINQTVRLNDLKDLIVTGVLEDIPGNSTFEFEFLTTWATNRELNEWVENSVDNWGNNSFQVYMELDDPENETIAENAIVDLINDNLEDANPRPYLFLHPLKDWRLYSEFKNGVVVGGRIEFVQLFSIIAIFILVIACINFMNLATARSERRAKEVGIRKCVGSQKRQLVMQFMGESILIATVAFIVALLITLLVLPFYNDLVDKELVIDFTSWEFWIFTIVLILFTGVVSGSYPALYLSRFKPVTVLKGKVKVGKGASLPRRILVVIQFGFSILLIMGTITIHDQISLISNRQLGYDQRNLIAIANNTDISKNYQTIKKELLRSGVVESVAKSNSPITAIYSNNFLAWPGMPEGLRVLFTTIATEYDYTKTMGIKMVMGRDFSEEFASDSSAIIVNKAGLEVMGLQEPILGTELNLWGDKRTLIGVVDDVIMGSPYQEVKPMMMILEPEWTSTITIRLKPTDNFQRSLDDVERVFNTYNSSYPFDYSFVDEDFREKFSSINMTSTLANLFAALAIIITCLGLFGLAAFSAEQRTKEIGVRKVLGASVEQIIALMCRDFSKLVIVAFVIAAPMAWYFLNNFLENNYPIHTRLQWWMFLTTGIIALGLALIIVGTQALKAAVNDPVKSLRSE